MSAAVVIVVVYAVAVVVFICFNKLLTMDVIELTLLLKSIGFRLNSIDFDEQHFAAKKNGDGMAAATVGTSPKHQQADTGDHFINVQISCSKSEIVSHLSLKLNGDHKATDTATVEPNKCTAACTCPKREKHDDNNSFWEVQSSGTFANRRRSMNALLMVRQSTHCCLELHFRLMYILSK